MGKIRLWAELGKDRDDFSWLLCTNRQGHEQEKLMLTQIIAADSLVRLGEQLHFEREQWGIPQFCGCIKSESTNGVGKVRKLLYLRFIFPTNLQILQFACCLLQFQGDVYIYIFCFLSFTPLKRKLSIPRLVK